MIETIDGAVPPVTPCPSWCAQSFHPWEHLLGGEWQREHFSRELVPDGTAHTVRFYTADSWFDGEFDRPEPILVLHDGTCLTIGDLDTMARLLRSL